MDRREALKLLASAAVLPSLSPDAFALFRRVHAQIAEAPGLKTLNPHQDATVIAIAEAILPETDTPGAKAVKVDEFIDLILSDWFDAPDTSRFLAGLADVDERSQKLFSRNFIDCAQSQQNQLLTALDQEAFVAAEQEEELERHKVILDPLNSPHFFYTIKKLTLIGYYTSEVGFEDELHESIIPPVHAGCAPLAPELKQ